MKLVADGDSWIGYPKLLGGNLGSHLAYVMDADIINLAANGYSSEETCGLKSIEVLKANLVGADLFLISSGGDDFAGDQFRLAVNKNIGQGYQNAPNWNWFNAAMDLIIADYMNLSDLRDEVCPNAFILTHSYGFPPPEMMGKGVLWYGPWLQPGFVNRGWTNPVEQSAIIQLLLVQFEKRLAVFAKTNRNHIHTNLQQVLLPKHFSNELHLNWDGWELAAKTINMNWLSTQARASSVGITK